MMSFRQWLVLLALYIVFMLLGSVVFLSLEVGYELAQRNETFALKQQAIEVLSELGNRSRAEVETLLVAVGQQCNHDFLHLTQDDPPTWTLWNSFFFTFTVITTIGFGHMSPATTWGRIFCIIYAFFGVPLNGILIASLAELLSSKIINSQVRRRAVRYESRVGVALDAFLYLVPGLIIFLLLPATVLMVVEVDWNFLDSFYFAFITLTTIGFGDYVGGLQEHDHALVWIYKVVMVVWIIFGLGYIVMIITFVQKALKSKKVHNLERKMASVFKRHVSRLNVSINRDLQRIRTVVNTLAVMQPPPPVYLEDKRDDTIAQKVVRKVKKHGSYDPTFQPATPTASDVIQLLHHTPTSAHHHTRRSRLPRSASESDLASVDKMEALHQLQSISNINMFLDMMEALVLEHEASAADDVEDEVRHIVEEAEGSSSESDFESCKKSHGSHSSEVVSRDLEIGYLNQGFVSTEDEASPGHRPRQEPQLEEETKRYERLKNRLNLLLKGKPSRNTSLPESPREGVKAPTHLLGDVVSTVSQPPPSQPATVTAGPRPQHRVSRSVPARIKAMLEPPHSHLTTIFLRPHSIEAASQRQPPNGVPKDQSPSKRNNLPSDLCSSACPTDETQQTLTDNIHSVANISTVEVPPGHAESEEICHEQDMTSQPDGPTIVNTHL